MAHLLKSGNSPRFFLLCLLCAILLTLAMWATYTSQSRLVPVVLTIEQTQSSTTSSGSHMIREGQLTHHKAYYESLGTWGIMDKDIQAIFKNTAEPQFLKNYKNPCWFQGNGTGEVFRCLPYFYELGVGKSGTSELYRELIKHPDIEPPIRKELFYWNTSRKNISLEKYTRFFARAAKKIHQEKRADGFHQRVTFEATPAYFTNQRIMRQESNMINGEYRYTLAHVLYSLNPQTKLIVTMRNPTNRLYSHYHHFHFRGFSPRDFHTHVVTGLKMMKKCLATKSLRMCAFDHPLNQAIRQGGRIMLHYSMYYPYAKEWLDVFPRAQILFIKAEEFYANEPEVMVEVFKFLELDNLDLNNSVADNRPAVSSPNKIRKTEYRETMLKETRQILDEFFEPFNKQLAQLLGDDKWLFSDSRRE